MKNPFSIGDEKRYSKTVVENETARFESGEVHPFYGTFALARDAEWSSRLFVLEMKESDEEGIGTFVKIEHVSPALVGDRVEFTATITRLYKNSIDCGIVAYVGDRLIAKGSTGQKILKKDKIQQIKEALNG